MREIKFRAWDKNRKIIVDVEDLSENSIGYKFNTRKGNTTTIHHKRKRRGYFNLMQYTGLKDKNGNEIYEGDILDYPSHWRWYVGFEDGCFRRIPISIVQRLNWEHHPLEQSGLEYWEIIGNIYENLELLKED